MERNRQPYDDVLALIGWTPLIRLNRVTRGIRTPVYAKAEFFNPGGSIKDRIGVPIIEQAEREGRLKPGGTIVEGTSGNTGIGLAIAAALKGYKCIFTMPDKMSQEKVRLLKAFGAEVIVTPTAVPPDHPDNYVMMAKRIAHETPNAILANQFYNDANPQAHYDTTGPEIWEQTEGRVTHFVVRRGNGRHDHRRRALSQGEESQDPDHRRRSGRARSSPRCGGRKGEGKPEGVPYKVEGIGQDKIPGTLDMGVIDDFMTVSDKESFAMARRLTREEGLFVGGSSGLIVHVALHVARRIDDPNALVVAPLPDTGERYLSKLYNDEWMRENQLLDADRTTLDYVLEREASRRRRHADDRERDARRDGAAGAATHVAARRVAAAGDGRHELRRLGERLVAVGEESRQHEAARRDRGRGDGRVRFRSSTSAQPVDTVAKLLSKSNPAVLVRSNGTVQGIVTRSDMLNYLMAR